MTLQQWIDIFFLFALGSCVGSFLNVVVYRLPREQSLVSPGSRCPKCATPLAWYDNLPVLGWLKLRGKCRYCKQPISPRYPIIEAITGGLFVFYFICFFVWNRGPCETRPLIYPDGSQYFGAGRRLDIVFDWPMYGMYMYCVASLLAASLIDAELFIIPVGIAWLMAIVGIVGHTAFDDGTVPGALIMRPESSALAAGGAIGLAISMVSWWRGWLPQSFPDGEPALSVDRADDRGEQNANDASNHNTVEDTRDSSVAAATPAGEENLPPIDDWPEMSRTEIFAEIRKEMLFLTPACIGAMIFWWVTRQWPAVGGAWDRFQFNHYVNGFLGSVFGAMIGGLVVWLTRILGTLGFGRVAMGLGDVHLMFGVGAIIGAGASTVSFFLAPFFGIVAAVYFMLSRTRRELPYGPYLSMAVGVVMIFYCPIATYLTPGFEGLGIVVHNLIGG